MSFPRGRGRIQAVDGAAIIVARCPLCGREHRYNKGEINGAEIEEIRRLGFSDEWLPCQRDLPGNFWRVIVSSGNKTNKASGRRARPATAT